MAVRSFDRVSLIEWLDARDRGAKLRACLLQTEMLRGHAFDDDGHLVIVRHEDAVDRYRPPRQAAEFAERSRRASDIAAFRIFAVLLGRLN